MCAYAAAADGAHTLGTHHAGSENEVDAGPQGTEKQVSLGDLTLQSPGAKKPPSSLVSRHVLGSVPIVLSDISQA
jgi:hypothetical protein